MTGSNSEGTESPSRDGDGIDYERAEIVACDDCGGVGFTVLVHPDGTTELECTSCPATKWGRPDGATDSDVKEAIDRATEGSA